MKTTISILIAILCFTNVFAQRGETKNEELPLKKRYKTNNGIFIYNGKYIEPPYVITIKNLTVYINDCEMFTPKDPYDFNYFDHDPGFPSNIDKNMTWKALDSIKEPIKNLPYISAKFKFLYTHFTNQQAADSFLIYIQKLPNVKFYDGFHLVTYSGDSINMSNIATGIITKGKDLKPITHLELLEKAKKKAFNYYEMINNDKCIMAKDDNYWKPESNLKKVIDWQSYNIDSDYFLKLIKIISANIPQEEKNKQIKDSLNNIYYPIYDDFNLSNDLNKRIEQILKKAIDKKSKSDSNLLNLKSIDSSILINSTNKELQTGTTCYSPSLKIVNAWCSYTNEPSLQGDFGYEVSTINSRLSGQDYLSATEYSAEIGQPVGTCTYSNLKSICNTGVLYFGGHGEPTGLVLMIRNTQDEVLAWLNDGSNDYPSLVNVIKDPNTNYWKAIANQQWAEQYWKPTFTNNKSIVFIGACYSDQNNFLVSCMDNTGTNGVAFGFEGQSLTTESFGLINELLGIMNGTVNGLDGQKHRVANEAHANIDLDNYDLFMIQPTIANITLCPSVTNYNILYQPDVPNYIEFDTWCDANTNISDIIQTTVASGSAFVSNIHWVDNDNDKQSNRIEFSTDGCSGSFTVAVTVNNNKIKSWSDGGTGHINDFNGVAPAESTTYYTITSTSKSPASTITADFKADNTYIAKGSSVQFTATVSGGSPTYYWSFPGGSANSNTIQKPTVTYTAIGTFDVTLNAQSLDGCINIPEPDYITVYDDGTPDELIVYCSYSETGVPKQVSVTADVTGGSGSYKYYFTFSDGYSQEIISYSTSETVSYTFSQYGNFSCNVFVVDNINFTDNGSCSESINLQNPDPCESLNVDFSISPETIIENQTYSITDLTTGGTQPYTWCWQFLNDGFTGNVPDGGMKTECINGAFNSSGNPSFVNYNLPGIYQITLSVFSGTCVNYITKEITVVDPIKCISNLRIQNEFNSNFDILDANSSNCVFNFLATYSLSGCNTPGQYPYCGGNPFVADAIDAQWTINGATFEGSQQYNGYGLNGYFYSPDIYELFTPSNSPYIIRVEIDNTCATNVNNYHASFELSVIVLDCDYTAYINEWSDLYQNPYVFTKLYPPYMTITSGNFILDGNSYIKNITKNTLVTFSACNEIKLSDGFETGGGEFTATIKKFVKCYQFKNYTVVNTCEESVKSDFLYVQPNPFTEKTTILFSLKDDGFTNLSIYDLNGKLVQTIINNLKQAGDYEFELWNENLTEGIYICTLTHIDKIQSIKIIKTNK